VAFIDMSKNCAGVILSGGLNTRMEGQNKAFLKINGKRFIDSLSEIFASCFSERFLVTRESHLYTEVNFKIVEDVFTVQSPLSGIYAALINMESEYAFCTSCDVPLLKREVVRIIVKEIESGIDVVVPAFGMYYQPLCAVYSKRCIPFIEKQLACGNPKVDDFYESVKLKRVSYEKIKCVDPTLASFFNVNTKKDLERSEKIYDESDQLFSTESIHHGKVEKS
jgi:molybdopterin-guanine dinucleotide biosynthesis protein A